MEVRPGYKQTEVGVIPEDWEVRKFGEFAAPRKDRVDPRKSGTQEFCIELEHVGQASGRLVGSTSTGPEASLKTAFQTDDVLFGKLRAYLRKYWLAECGGVCSTEIWALHANPRWVTPSFVYQVVTSDSFIEAASNSYGTHMPRSDWNIVRSCEFALPPMPEQRAIAAALSDVDILLAKLDQFIAKKRDLKQAAMQQLLTGQARLPGFSGEWEVKLLGSICEKITTGKLDANAMVADGDYPFFTCAKEHYWINKYAFDVEALLVSGNGANVGYIHHYHGKFNAYQRTYVLTGFSEDIHYTKLFMERNLQERLRAEVNAGNTPYIVMDTLAKMVVTLPSKIEEQRAIATVLSDMDAEITALEARREKTRALKQGMMQELLTGKIRLI
ncbi:MAG: restriction endonuclease subunit S [Desulfocapsaceae bacterium]|nr:restriction endonuclease subunit S [Desulfocapsaceae bacterium]